MAELADDLGGGMTVTEPDVRYDMFDREIFAEPYPVFRRLREEAPLYRNEEHDFWAVSRYDDVARVLGNRDDFVSGRGMTYEIAKACLDHGLEMPEGLFICEDPPTHTIHRGLVARLFTPRAVNGLEAQIRDLCLEVIEPLAERDHFDAMSDLANQIPIKVIGMLLGLPKEDQAELHDVFHQTMHVESEGADGDALGGIAASAEWFNWYLDERVEHPADDVMTQLLHLELTDADGETRVLRRDEILTYLTLIASAGSDTTAMALGWAIQLLADHPDQRQAVLEDRALIPTTVEEVIRYEAVSYHSARVLVEDVEIYGTTVPAGSVMVVLPGAANRDDRHFEDPDTFLAARPATQNLTFGFGPHFCLGASLARLELRIALDALLDRFPSWAVDHDHAALLPGANTRGWDRLPIEVT